MHTPLYGGWGQAKPWNQKTTLDSIETHNPCKVCLTSAARSKCCIVV